MRNLYLLLIPFIALASPANAETVRAGVNGLVCAFCATGIEKTFKAQAAVEKVKVDLESKLVTIDFKPHQTMDNDTITTLLTNAGYTVTSIKRDK